MDTLDVLIVGAGVVGLACARELTGAGREVAVAEKNSSFGEETSSRNSEVIHAGLYYRPGSLKARLCIEGSRLMRETCARRGIPWRQTGKLVVATDGPETEQLEALRENAETCGAADLRMLTGEEVSGMEPAVRAAAGLLSPDTGIVDTHSLMAFYLRDAEEGGAIAVFDSPVVGIAHDGDAYVVELGDRDGTRVSARVVVNSAGLHADAVAGMAGIDVAGCGYALRYAKGEYFRAGGKSPVRGLVYPVPEPGGGHLGIHTVIDLAGSMKIGPNEYYIDDLDYSVDPANLADACESVRRFIPCLREEDLTPDMAGIRPRLHAEGGAARDFVIRDEAGRGLPGFIDLLGIESPGLTAAPAIAKYVASLAATYF